MTEMKLKLASDFGEAREAVTAALKEQGFGVLTTIDVQATLREKLGHEMERYEILGACNPTLAHRALETDREIGLLLPCNVVLRESDGGVEVSILDPERMFRLAGDGASLGDLPSEAKTRLQAALDSLRS